MRENPIQMIFQLSTVGIPLFNISGNLHMEKKNMSRMEQKWKVSTGQFQQSKDVETHLT